jgi:hypothetical protein
LSGRVLRNRTEQPDRRSFESEVRDHGGPAQDYH